jgi:hypothetical protein
LEIGELSENVVFEKAYSRAKDDKIMREKVWKQETRD